MQSLCAAYPLLSSNHDSTICLYTDCQCTDTLDDSASKATRSSTAQTARRSTCYPAAAADCCCYF
eukprot:12203-Heterococcus_DN1.PRE.5